MDWATILQSKIASRDSEGLKAALPARGDNLTPLTYSGCGKCEGGFVLHKDENGNTYATKCECQIIKEARRNLEKSGLAGVVEQLTFDTFSATEPWQKTMLDTAKAYVVDITDGNSPWFYIGGQVGCGKTHICTAIAGALLKANIAVKYAIWPGEVALIKAHAMDAEKRENLMYPLITTPVLYVDDFLKTVNKGDIPTATDADVRLAFELFNARYTRNLPTIISCEWPIKNLLGVDEGTMSRIYQKSEGYRLGIGRDSTKNYRMKGA